MIQISTSHQSVWLAKPTQSNKTCFYALRSVCHNLALILLCHMKMHLSFCAWRQDLLVFWWSKAPPAQTPGFDHHLCSSSLIIDPVSTKGHVRRSAVGKSSCLWLCTIASYWLIRVPHFSLALWSNVFHLINDYYQNVVWQILVCFVHVHLSLRCIYSLSG